MARTLIYGRFCTSLFLCPETQGNHPDSHPPANTRYVDVKHQAYALYDLQCFVDELLADDTQPFQPDPNRHDRDDYTLTTLAVNYFQLIPDFIRLANILSPVYEHNERHQVFADVCRAMGLLQAHPPLVWNNYHAAPKTTYAQWGDSTAAEQFNRLVVTIRQQWKDRGFQAKAHARAKEADKQFKNYCRYIDALFKAQPKMQVIRIQLSYKKQLAYQSNGADLNSGLNHFFRNKRSTSLLTGMAGYIAKLEFNLPTGLYWHLVLFFDESKGSSVHPTHLAQSVGEYWATTITKGAGAFRIAVDETNHVPTARWTKVSIQNALKEHIVLPMCKQDPFFRLNRAVIQCGAKIKLMRRGLAPNQPAKTRQAQGMKNGNKKSQ